MLRQTANQVLAMLEMKLPSANDVVLRTNGKHEKAGIRLKCAFLNDSSNPYTENAKTSFL